MPNNKDVEISDSFSRDIIYLLSPIQNLYKQNIEVLMQPFGISAGQPPLIALLTENDGICQKDLAIKLNVKPSSVTNMLDRMEKAGIVERRKDPKDKRMTRVYLTSKGRKSSKKMAAVIRFMNERNLAGFRSEEKVLLLRLLEQMKRNLENEKTELGLIKNYITK